MSFGEKRILGKTGKDTQNILRCYKARSVLLACCIEMSSVVHRIQHKHWLCPLLVVSPSVYQ